MTRPNPTRQKEARKLLKQRMAKLDFQNETMLVLRRAADAHHLNFQVPNGDRLRVRLSMTTPIPAACAIFLESSHDGASWPMSATKATTRPSMWRRAWQRVKGWVRP